MKTIKEKAAAYDQVVNKLKRFMMQGVDPLITRADVQDFFPELKESEDERIRKEMIETISKEAKEFPSSYIASKAASWIAWLEKQKGIKRENEGNSLLQSEQKPSNDNSNAVHNYLVSLANAGKFSIPEIVETLRIISTCLNAEYLNNGKR